MDHRIAFVFDREAIIDDEIIDKVKSADVDLLVLSSRKLGVIGRLLGSTTESLLSRCPCSLLIVHDQPDSAEQTNSAERAAEKKT